MRRVRVAAEHVRRRRRVMCLRSHIVEILLHKVLWVCRGQIAKQRRRIELPTCRRREKREISSSIAEFRSEEVW